MLAGCVLWKKKHKTCLSMPRVNLHSLQVLFRRCRLLSAKVGATELVGETQSQLAVLEHVLEAEEFDLVLGGVDVVVGVWV